MMAPEMSPTLDDALRAMETAGINPPDYSTAHRFLCQLDAVRGGVAEVLDSKQSALLEGAYQAGVRCADESGRVLVASPRVLLGLMGRAPAPVWPGFLSAGLAAVLGVLVGIDHASEAALVMLLAAFVHLTAAVLALPDSLCNQDCAQGRNCTCAPAPMADAYVGAREDAAIWKKRALEAEAKLRQGSAEAAESLPNGGSYAR